MRTTVALSTEGAEGNEAAEERHAAEQLFNRCHKALMSFLNHRLQNSRDAEDIAQEVYYRIVRRPDMARIQHAEAFLYQTAINLVKDFQRSRRRRRAEQHVNVDEQELLDDHPSAEVFAQAQQELAILRQALAELSPKCQAVFIMNRFDGESYQQIADKLGINVSTVGKHISKAVAQLKLKLEQRHRQPRWQYQGKHYENY